MFKNVCLLLAICCIAIGAAAQDSNYSFELTPSVGLNLPNNTAGANKSLYVYGLQTDIPFDGAASIVSGLYAQKRGNDSAYTFDLGVRINLDAKIGELYADTGLHYSKVDYDGSADRNSDGSCYIRCRSTSGSKFGYFAGGGVVYPVGSVPFRLGGRFYFAPKTWLLLYIGVALRY